MRAVDVRAQPRHAVRQEQLAVFGLEEELPQAVVAVLGEPPPEVHGEKLVLRVPQLHVAGDDPGALEAEPLVRPDALLLRAHDDVLGPETVHHEVDHELEEPEGDGRHQLVAAPVLGEDREPVHFDRAGRAQLRRQPEVLLRLEPARGARRDPHRPDGLARRDVTGDEKPGPPIVGIRDRDVVPARPIVDAPADVERGVERGAVGADVEAVSGEEIG